MQEQILDMLLKEEEISWKTIIYDLVRSEEINPWDVNVTILTKKYIEVIKKMQEHDLRLSGKVLLAAAILLKIKSTHLIDNDISKLDLLLNQTEELDENEDDFYDAVEGGRNKRDKEQYTLIPRNPQPRNRKVSVNDLVNALQRAMTSKKRFLERIKPVKFTMPDKHIDIMAVIKDIYHKIQYYSNKDKKKELTFSNLLPPRAGKQEKVYTFLPLLHLENQHKVEMNQDKAFEEIKVKLTGK